MKYSPGAYMPYRSGNLVIRRIIMKNSNHLSLVCRSFAMLLVLFSVCALIATGCTEAPLDEEVVIGIAWRADLDSEFYTNVVAAIEKAGAKPVLLEQVKAEYLAYDDDNKLVGCEDEVGSLTIETANAVKANLWEGTNVEDVMQDIDAVIFTGGEDISSSLYATPEPWHGIEAEIDFNATRDVSDYILMSYCIDKNIAVVGFCRGMQMLAVVGGAKMIQDIPTHFENLNKEYQFQHRNEKATPQSYRDYAPHDVSISPNSLAHKIYQTDVLSGCPSWHHQAVLNVDHTNLIVTGSVDTNSEQMIEIIEYRGKDFIMGFQFHPEAAAVKHLQGADNANDFMSLDTALLVFGALIDEIRQ